MAEVTAFPQVPHTDHYGDSVYLIDERQPNGSTVPFALGANIDLEGKEFSPIGSSGKPFNGNFNGAGFKISNFKINGTADDDQVGLFGNIASSGVLRNLLIEGFTVTGDEMVGGLAGYSAGTIQRVGVHGPSMVETATNTGRIGGLVGKLYKPGLIEESYSNSSVSVRSTAGAYDLGGLAGSTGGLSGDLATIRNSYSHASISSSGGNIGGLVGYTQYLTLTNSYFAGRATDTGAADSERGVIGNDWGGGSSANTFFDSDVCASASGNCASSVLAEQRGVSTALAKTVATYLRTGGWNFKTIWTTPGQVYSGQYPVLLWESGQSALSITLGGGNGSVGTPYLLSAPAHINALFNDSDLWTADTILN